MSADKNIVEYSGKTIEITKSWDGLTKSELLLISKHWPKIYLSGSEGEKSNAYYLAKSIILKKMLKMSGWTFGKMTVNKIACLMPLVDFLNEELDLNTQLIPEIRILGKTYYGPLSKLSNSSFDEFITADTLFMKISKGDHSLLDNLAATLYRPKPSRSEFTEIKKNRFWNGDIRQPFNNKRIIDTSKHFKRFLPLKYKWAIFYFYWGFRNQNVTVFENLFPKPKEDEKEQPKKEGNNYGWAGSLLEISGDKFGAYNETSSTNWFTIFVEMSRRADERQKQKEQRAHQISQQRLADQAQTRKQRRR